MIKTVIFDFDGVIVDSYEATIYYMQKTLRHFNKKVPQKKDFDKLLGLKTKDILRALLPNIKEKELDKIYEYSKEESFKAVSRIILINGAKNILEQLANSYKLGVASSRGKRTIDALLDKFKLRFYFKSIISREDTTCHKPHPESILKTLSQLKMKAKEAVYVGDMEEDVLAAKAAGVISIFVKHKRKENYKADFSVKNITKIPKVLNEIF